VREGEGVVVVVVCGHVVSVHGWLSHGGGGGGLPWLVLVFCGTWLPCQQRKWGEGCVYTPAGGCCG